MSPLTVVLTRPIGKYSGSAELSSRLERKGFSVRCLGVLEYVPLEIHTVRASLTAVVEGKYDWIVFSSPIAVGVFRDLFDEVAHDKTLPASTKFAVQGPGTAQALERYLNRVANLTPGTYVAESLAERLCETLSEKSRVLHPGAKAGRDAVQKELEVRGFSIERLPTYETRPCNLSAAEKNWLENAKAKELLFVFMSPSAVAACVSALEIERSELLLHSSILSVGPITSREIEKHGLNVLIECREHSEGGVIDSIEQFRSTRAREWGTN